MKKKLSGENFDSVIGVKKKTQITLLIYLMLSLSLFAKEAKNLKSKEIDLNFGYKSDFTTFQEKEITISGKVTDDKGIGIPGVSIMIKGPKIGIVSDFDGNFKMDKVPLKSVLVFSFIGMQTQEITVDGKLTLNVIMKEALNDLNEVVVIGYGTAKRKDLTGSVASVSMEELKDIPATSVLQAIAGRLAGVNVTIADGSPDTPIKVRVRGGGSITQDNSPLYIVDGFQVNNINDIAPSDIESIDVLKDASSTAIYGAQGANGVILITTKSGKTGKTEINMNAYTGIKNTYNLTEVLSPYDFVYFQKELDPGVSATGTSFYSMYGSWDDIDIYKSKKGTDWQEKLYGNTGVQKHFDIGITGGESSLKYKVNYVHDDEDYIMLNSAYKRDYLSVSLNKKISTKLTFDFNTRISNTVITGPSVSNGSKLRDGIKYAPVYSLTSQPGNALGGADDITSAEALSTLNDPVYNITNEYKEQNRFNATINAGIIWKPVKGLTVSSKGSYGANRDYTDNIWLNKTGEASANGGQPVARRTDFKGYLWTIQNTVSYNADFNNNIHKFDIMAGQEMYNSEGEEMRSESKFYPVDFTAKDVLAMWNYGTPQPTYTTILEPSRTSSLFGRVNYTFHERYILTLTARLDSKNVFSEENRQGFFPGAAFAWRLSDESFMKPTSKWLSNAKVRLSYGEVGNARVGSYWRQEYGFQTSAKNLYYLNDQPQSALVTSNVLKNEKLTWETTISSDIGLDLGFFNQRLRLTVDAYKNDTKDLILGVALPSNSGYDTQYQNIGRTSNKGLEITASGDIIKNDKFLLSASFNIAFNNNVVKELDGSSEMIAASNWAPAVGRDDFRAIVGQPVGLMYGYVSDGYYTFDDFTFDDVQKKWILNPGVADASKVITTSGNYFGPGHIKLKKLTDDGTNVISPDKDRKVIGRAQPKHTGGFSISTAYKGFDLSAMFNWSYGNDIYNANKIDNTTFSGSKRYQNMSAEMSIQNRFTTIDPATGYNIMFGQNANPELLQEINQGKTLWHPLSNSTILTDWAIEDGSFLRFGSLTLGYTLPESITKNGFVQNVRCYFTGNNLMIWTKYSGQDPEVDGIRTTPLTPGVDWSAYPKAKTFLFGVNVTF
ncbi:SusC/RagA family TonB-linked outer membrane protein [Flavobacterium ajazii]|uniref:SusC/RagA family TonB-linked outer membrane protein n=1 Tax=Flavobacterium ajazii TaxID=2692318 RepID=UPI001CB6E599|nr:TonB-dependent receptor [Flavobacterium ajazii]